MRDDTRSPRTRKGKNLSKEEGDKVVCHTLKTITRGFDGDGETSFPQREYARQILTIEDLPIDPKKGETKAPEAEISFSKKDEACVHPHNDDPMVITVRCDDWKIKRVLVDQGSSINILYWDAFDRFYLDPDDLKAFKGHWLGFLGSKYK